MVRFIFDEALNKKKLIEIVKELNDKGIVYSDGKSNWNINKLSRLLRNEKYIGLARFHESVFDNIVPAIIDDSVFKNAGRLLDRNKHKCKMKSERRFLLSGKIFVETADHKCTAIRAHPRLTGNTYTTNTKTR